ncbi:single-stranded-DNA-specific exonuclease RecJ [Prochlorococcus marinus]|uniref:single-stranded-DNA-specific exonuclease RecJ n=1 Tax=Prochlorococcus marinus TaxID=1219 RepID=UPI0022B50658|nr:single-stranded-DNA-specific exonuclease RecJ [Prochlorococcus marinus]
MKTDYDQLTRWILPKPINDDELDIINLNYTLQKVLIRRGIDLNNEFDEYISPSELPNPEHHFNELSKASLRIIEACSRKEQIAICGDYDADGITSTVLLVELLSTLGARVKPYIPSRQDEGYGLNLNMINEINNEKTTLIITVDNGISAFDAIKKSNELGIDLIITDHHKIPDVQLDIFSLIHPELTPIYSPYKYLAGVGIAFLLAKNICNKLNFDINRTAANALFCIGTVADMAPLKGANRKWLKESLPKINTTTNKGIKSILKNLSIDQIALTSDDIGYKIAPLINAVGRIGDPLLVIDLLTNESNKYVDKLTKECFAINRERKRITALIEQEAIEIALSEYKDNNKFLVLKKKEWHPGIIGIVAARIVDKFNLPTAIIAKTNDGMFRGSIRSNNILNVNRALDECSDLLIAHGGHSAAAGFSIKEENISMLREKLNKIANREFKNIDLNKSIKPDAYLSFVDINYDFYKQLSLIGPFGMMNPAPIFWTRKCKIINIYKLKGDHLKMILNDGTCSIDAIKWNGSMELNNNDLIDIAFYIEINRWHGTEKLQLNIIDIKKHKDIIDLKMHNHLYKCQINDNKDILITNVKGQCISSDASISSKDLNIKQIVFAKKILTYAEVALGKAA